MWSFSAKRMLVETRERNAAQEDPLVRIADRFSDDPLPLPDPSGVPFEFFAGCGIYVLGVLIAKWFSDNVELQAALEASYKAALSGYTDQDMQITAVAVCPSRRQKKSLRGLPRRLFERLSGFFSMLEGPLRCRPTLHFPTEPAGLIFICSN